MKRATVSVVIVSQFLIFNFFVNPVCSAADSDSLMTSIPEDALFCVRINNYSESLEQLDQYLAGVSPMSLSLMLNMGLGGIFGNPMLAGINKYGTFAIVGTIQPGQNKPAIAFLVPVNDFAQFVSASPNCHGPYAQEQYTIVAASGMNLTMKPVFGNLYALIVPNIRGNSFEIVHAWLNTKGKGLGEALAPADLQKAVSAPCWARVNLQTIYKLVSPLLKQEQTSAENPFTKLMSKISQSSQQIDALLQQMDSLFVTLSPQSDLLSVESALVPKAGSELASIFARKSPMASRFTAGGYLDPQSQINGLMNLNKPMLLKLNEIMLKILAGMGHEDAFAERTAKFKSLMEKSTAAVGSEAAISFGYCAGFPPFTLRQVVEVSDSKAFSEAIVENAGLMNQLYLDMKVPATFTIQEEKENYKGLSINQAIVRFALNDSVSASEKTAIEALYGKEGLVYPFTVSKNHMIMTMGPDADRQLKNLIDQQDRVPPMPQEMQDAINRIPQANSADMILSVNIVRLMKGMSEMMAQISKTAFTEGMPAPPFAQAMEGIAINTQSSMAIGTHIDQGRIQTRMALPKQHLTEVMAMAMQVQQKIMMQTIQQQMSQSQPASSASGEN